VGCSKTTKTTLPPDTVGRVKKIAFKTLHQIKSNNPFPGIPGDEEKM
jgi:hypothetical protein